jgi:chromosome segregation ATPase
MTNAANLSGLLSKLDARQNALSTDIANAQAEVARAQKAVSDLEGTISRLTQTIAEANRELQFAANQPPTTRAPIETRLNTARAQLNQETKELDKARGQLATVLAAKKEDNARRSLEQARADFLIETKMLLASSHDAAVRYLLAVAALDALRNRNIAVSAFGSLTDKQTASDIIASLNVARDSAAEGDRQEATRFEELRRLVDGVTNSQTEFLAAVDDAQQQSVDLAAKRDDLQKQIAELQAASAASEAERKKRGSSVFAWFGNAASAVGDKFRGMKLSSRTSDLDSTIEKLEKLETEAPHRMQVAQENAKQYADRLARVEFGPETPTSPANSKDPYAAVAERARAYLQRWVQAHLEIEKVVPGIAH